MKNILMGFSNKIRCVLSAQLKRLFINCRENSLYEKKPKQHKSQKSFFELRSVWITLSINIAFVIFFTYVIYQDLKPQIEFSHNGINTAIQLFRVPLLTISLLIPIFTILAIHHRSAQTAHQILIMQQQNIFTNHFKHLEEFKKYLEPIGTNSHPATSIHDKGKLYTTIFPNTRRGDFEVSSMYCERANTFATHCLKACKNLAQLDINEHYKDLTLIATQVDDISKTFFIYFSSHTSARKDVTHEGISTTLPENGDIKNLITRFIYSASVINNALSFDPNYTASELLKNISNKPTELIRDIPSMRIDSTASPSDVDINGYSTFLSKLQGQQVNPTTNLLSS